MAEALNWKGLFLGAGASYDFGFPMTVQLTKEIRDFLTPDKLINLNERWKQQGGGMLDETISITIDLLNNNDLHYEQMVGVLEVEARRLGLDKELYQDLHHMKSWLVDLIHILLKERQIKNSEYIAGTLELYKRFKNFVSVDYPFWVFTLNHDVVVEILAAHFGINLCTGLYNKGRSFPLRSPSVYRESRINFLEFDIADFGKEPLNFYNNIADRGINLFKLHGALDLFVFDDRKKYLKIDFEGCSDHLQVIERLKAATDLLEEVAPVRCTNMISFRDDDGEVQFLDKSILTGVHKFEGVSGQIIPDDILQQFKSHINYVKELYVVGYSFGDIHVNQVFRKWLTMKPYHKMIIIDPFRSSLPEEFKIYFKQCEVRQQGFIEFLAEETGDKLTKKEKLLLSMRKDCRDYINA